MLPVLLLLAAFLLMVTALTYQFQGWLAALMSNPRRRRTVIMVMTVIFVLIAQAPQLIRFIVPGGAGRPMNRTMDITEEMKKLDRAFEIRGNRCCRARTPRTGSLGKAAGRGRAG